MDAFQHFAVVVNGEEQHSVWPTDLAIPAGWRATGFTGGKDECLRHIDSVWPDIRPLSLRTALGIEATT